MNGKNIVYRYVPITLKDTISNIIRTTSVLKYVFQIQMINLQSRITLLSLKYFTTIDQLVKHTQSLNDQELGKILSQVPKVYGAKEAMDNIASTYEF